MDLAPLGSVKITVFIMMLIAGIFQGYGNLALAYTATDFSKELGMTPAALAAAFSARLFGVMQVRARQRESAKRIASAVSDFGDI